jgi:hypothetical protein
VRARIAGLITAVALTCVAGPATAQVSQPAAAPNPADGQKPTGPVQGYQGGYDPTDKSKAPAIKGTAPDDAANADEGGATREVTGRVARVDNAAMTLTLDDGQAFTLPPTVEVNYAELKPGTVIRVSVQRRGNADHVTGVRIAEGPAR